MFAIKKIYFESEDVSVEVSGDYYPADDSECIDGGLAFYAIDGSHTVIYEILHDGKGTKKTLLETQKEDYGKNWEIEDIELNGLKGHCSTYGESYIQFYEARFLLGETEKGCTEFAFVVYTRNHDIEEIKASDHFKKLLNGIRKKDNARE